MITTVPTMLQAGFKWRLQGENDDDSDETEVERLQMPDDVTAWLKRIDDAFVQWPDRYDPDPASNLWNEQIHKYFSTLLAAIVEKSPSPRYALLPQPGIIVHHAKKSERATLPVTHEVYRFAPSTPESGPRHWAFCVEKVRTGIVKDDQQIKSLEKERYTAAQLAALLMNSATVTSITIVMSPVDENTGDMLRVPYVRVYDIAKKPKPSAGKPKK